MTKKIILTLSQDGTGNNKVNDSDTGNQTNVAKIHDTLIADYSFNISDDPDKNGTSSLEDVTIDHIEGNSRTFEPFINSISGNDTDIAPGDDPLHIKLYQNGVGSRGDGSFQDTWEGATGTGTGARIKTFSDAIEVIHDAYGGDVEIEINCIGFSRGDMVIKDLLNDVSDTYSSNEVHINRVVQFEPVSSIGVPPFTDNLAGYDLDYPAGADDNSHITEFYAANEYRRTFSLENYSEGNVDREVFPGAHAQIGGGYACDILAAGPFASAMDFLSQDDNLAFNEPSVEDPGHIQAGNELNLPPEGWELPDGEPMLDADGNPILLASNDPETADQILAGLAGEGEQTGQTSPEDVQPVRQPTEAEQAVANRGAELNVMHSEIDLRNAIDSGDGMDIAREGLGYLSSLNDYRDTVFHDGFIGDSRAAMVDGLEHGIGLGQAIDDGDGWLIADNSVDLLLDIDHYAESNNSDFISESGTGYLNAASSAFDLSLALDEGDGWQIASSTTSLLNDIDHIHDIDGGSGALGGAASVAGLAVNIAEPADEQELQAFLHAHRPGLVSLTTLI